MQSNKTNIFLIVCNLVFLIILYSTVSIYYYRKIVVKEHLFDPYLQVSSLLLDRASMHKESGVFRVLCLGGSTTLDNEVPEENRWPYLLQIMLQEAYPDLKVEIINAGMDWYTTKHSLINYTTYYRDWNPDLVIIMHGINDLYRSFSPKELAIGEYNDRWTHFYGPSINGAKSKDTFEENLKIGIENIFHKLFHHKEYPAESNYPLNMYVSIDMFKRHLTSLAQYVHFDNANLILMTQPSLYKPSMKKNELALLGFGKMFCTTRVLSEHGVYTRYPSAKSLADAMNLFNDATKEIAQAKGAILLDAASRIPKDLDYFIDDVHYTKKGSGTLAKFIAHEIIKLNILD
jgi:lysophospholipase L1-like esterase